MHGRSADGRWHALKATMRGEPCLPAQGGEEEFTIEHYWGYTARRNGTSHEYEVRHSPWRVWRATNSTIDIDPGKVYGEAWSDLLDRPPTAVMVAEGSPIRVFVGQRVAHAPRCVDDAAMTDCSQRALAE